MALKDFIISKLFRALLLITNHYSTKHIYEIALKMLTNNSLKTYNKSKDIRLGLARVPKLQDCLGFPKKSVLVPITRLGEKRPIHLI